MTSSSRRRFLALGSLVGAGGTGGCLRLIGQEGTATQTALSDADGDGVIDSEDYAPRDPDVQREEQVRGSDESSTEPGTDTETDTGTTTEESSETSSGGMGEFVDSFERDSLGSRYVVQQGPSSDWGIESHIDGGSLHADKTDTGNGAIVLDPAEYSWGGDREISVRFQVNDDYWKQNAQLWFGDGDVTWRVHVGVQGNEVKLNNTASNGPVAEQSVVIDPTPVHELLVDVEGSSISVALDGTEHVRYSHDEVVGRGTVGVGVNGKDIEHETWFDDLAVDDR